MFSKVFPLFFVVVQLAFICSEDDFSTIPHLQTIQREMFAKMTWYTNAVWNVTARYHENYHFSAVTTKLQHYQYLMKKYHTNKTHLPQNTFLARPYAFASILEKLQNSTNAELSFTSVLIYDPNKTSSRYVEDMRKHFYTDAYPISFEPENEKPMLELLNEWRYRVTKGRLPKIEKIDLAGKTTYDYVGFNFKSCWDTTKRSGPLRRRRAPLAAMMPQSPKLHFEINKIIDVNAFDAKGKIGYYNDVERGYQAIRVPFSNEEFAMAILLPHCGYSLEVFRKFKDVDYQQLLQRVNQNHENVYYRLPVIDSAAIFMNEKGASVNGLNFYDCTVVREESNDNSNTTYRPFFVDKPFGVIIYHEKTSFVLLYALVRDPSSEFWPIYKVPFRTDRDGNEQNV